MSRIILKTADIRQQNKRKIVKYLLHHDLITKKELASKVNLSFATISNLTTQLIQANIIQISCYQDSDGGRSAGLLSAIGESRYTLAIYFSQKNIVNIQVMTLKKHAVLSIKEEVLPPYDAEAIFNACTNGVRKCEQQIADLKSNNLGIGIALPGIIEKETGRLINSTIVELEDQSILEELQNRLNYAVFAENESNLLALAVSSDAKSLVRKKDIIYLHVDDGLGVGIICNGELLCGSHGLGGEINAIPRCFGLKSQTPSLEQSLQFSSFIADYEAESGSIDISFTQFVEALKDSNNTFAQSVLKQKGILLGQLITVLDSLFDPTAFYLGGKIAIFFDQIAPYIFKEYRKHLVIKKDKELNLYPCKDYEKLLAEGCADLVFDHWDFS